MEMPDVTTLALAVNCNHQSNVITTTLIPRDFYFQNEVAAAQRRVLDFKSVKIRNGKCLSHAKMQLTTVFSSGVVPFSFLLFADSVTGRSQSSHKINSSNLHASNCLLEMRSMREHQASIRSRSGADNRIPR